MDLTAANLWPMVGVPLLIFCARLCDVSLATVRIILVSRGLRRVAPFIGFFEVLIWLVALGQVMSHLDHPINYIAYAGGFAGGTWLGIYLEGKIALGLVAVQIITTEDATDLIDRLRSEKFGVTSVAARGLAGNVRLIFSVLLRRDLGKVRAIVESTHPKAFLAISDVRSAREGYFPQNAGDGAQAWGGFLGLLRKGK
jgi:uncharacterized protein YebE (UPF0316 family)